MPSTPEDIAEFQKVYKESFNQDLSNEEAVEMIERLKWLYRNVLGYGRRPAALAEPETLEPVLQSPNDTVVVYVVRDGMLLVSQPLEFPVRDPKISAPSGAVLPEDGMPSFAAQRVAQKQTGRYGFRILAELGTDETDTGKRHFFLAEPAAALPKASWRVFSGKGKTDAPIEWFWLPLEQAAELADNQGAFAHLIDQAAD